MGTLRHPPQRTRRFVAREHDRQTLQRLGLGDVVQPRQLHTGHFPVQKQQRTLGLILRQRRYVALTRQMAQKALYMASRQRDRVWLAKIKDVAFNPINILIQKPMKGGNNTCLTSKSNTAQPVPKSKVQ